jgi:propionyl-CoA carboxylase beta chain
MDLNKQLLEKREASSLGGGKDRIEKQHAKSKLTARERIDLLLDEGSFNELGMFVEHRSTSFGLDKSLIPGDV